MKIKQRHNLWFLFIAILFFSCNQDAVKEEPVEKTTSIITQREALNNTGYINSSTGESIANVIIKQSNAVIGRSSEDGSFNISSESLREGQVLQFEHKDYIPVTKAIQSNSKLVITMKKRAPVSIINSRTGGVIGFESGGEITVPSNAFSLQGRPYVGEVAMRVSYIDVTNPNEVRSAPGSYIASDAGNLVPLKSFGMIEITAVTPRENQLLELSPGNAIQIALPVLTENTPDRVNFYELNRDTGLWDLRSTLRQMRSMLLGEVTTVNSAWNADEPCADALVCVKIQVDWVNGNPGCGYGATGETYNGFDGIHGEDPDGYVRFQVCPNEVFQLGACWILCCGPGVPLSDPCCNNPQERTYIDMSAVTATPDPSDGCIDLGIWVIN